MQIKKTILAAIVMALSFAGITQAATVNLYEKNPVDWTITADGGTGSLTYNESGETFDYKVTGTGLVVDTNYTLVYYPDPWPGTGLVCLGNATTTVEGAIDCEGSKDVGYNLPIDSDANKANGAKIWLVMTSDVDCGGQKMTGWNPNTYLFEDKLITYTKTEPVVTATEPAPKVSRNAGVVGGQRRMWEINPAAWEAQQRVFEDARAQRDPSYTPQYLVDMMNQIEALKSEIARLLIILGI